MDAIAITDHDTMDGYAIACNLSSEFSEILVIPGVEVSTREGHLIALGVLDAPCPGAPILDTIQEVRAMGGITILPHPFHRYRHGAGLKCPQAFSAVDAVEVYNSRYVIPHANQRAMRLARSMGKPGVAGSDAHNARFIGYGRTLIDAEKSVGAVIRAIKEGKTQPAGRKTPVRIYTKQSLRNSWRKIRGRIHK
jgi:predicted metal-dependent phosphoesterase TrpH